MLVPVVRAGENRPAFVPDNLLRVQESDAFQPIEHFPGEDRSVPDVSDLKAGYQFKGAGPVGARVAGNRRLRMSLGPMFHVTCLGRPAAVEASAVAPLGVK